MTTDPSEYGLEAIQPELTPEEACLATLLDLADAQEWAQPKPVSEFYKAFTGDAAPNDLETRIAASGPDNLLHTTHRTRFVSDFEVAGVVTVDFNSHASGIHGLMNFDFVKFPTGLQVYQRVTFTADREFSPRYVRQLTEPELAALSQDAATVKEQLIEEEAELMKLAPFVEEAADDGSRRFHIADILTITADKVLSPRGAEGVYDLLRYMTGETPFTNQIPRFVEECLPALQKQLGDIIGPYSKVPETVVDKLSTARWLNSIVEEMGGDPFLRVEKLDEGAHMVMDAMTEAQLDFGPLFTESNLEHDEPEQEPETPEVEVLAAPRSDLVAKYQAFRKAFNVSPEVVYHPCGANDTSPSMAFPDSHVVYVENDDANAKALDKIGLDIHLNDARTFDPGPVDLLILLNPTIGSEGPASHVRTGGYALVNNYHGNATELRADDDFELVGILHDRTPDSVPVVDMESPEQHWQPVETDEEFRASPGYAGIGFLTETYTGTQNPSLEECTEAIKKFRQQHPDAIEMDGMLIHVDENGTKMISTHLPPKKGHMDDFFVFRRKPDAIVG